MLNNKYFQSTAIFSLIPFSPNSVNASTILKNITSPFTFGCYNAFSLILIFRTTPALRDFTVGNYRTPAYLGDCQSVVSIKIINPKPPILNGKGSKASCTTPDRATNLTVKLIANLTNNLGNDEMGLHTYRSTSTNPKSYIFTNQNSCPKSIVIANTAHL